VGLRGATAGWTIVGLLVVFSLARGVASIAAKDTLGKTVSMGRRGRVSGYAATASGLVAGVADSIAFHAAILVVLGVAHAGVRSGRKTHVVDLAGGDRKAEYVVLSNTIIAVFLVMTGALISALLGFGLQAEKDH
jgi:hypothetical protein